jgi:hypothetical protein
MTSEDYINAAVKDDVLLPNLSLLFKNDNGFFQLVKHDPAAAILKAYTFITSILKGVLTFLGLSVIFLYFLYPKMGFEKTVITILLIMLVRSGMKK